jgi:hypothetical protein
MVRTSIPCIYNVIPCIYHVDDLSIYLITNYSGCQLTIDEKVNFKQHISDLDFSHGPTKIYLPKNF